MRKEAEELGGAALVRGTTRRRADPEMKRWRGVRITSQSKDPTHRRCRNT